MSLFLHRSGLVSPGGAAALTSLSFITHTSSATANFTYPASISAGDILITMDYAQDSAGLVTPTDFNIIIQNETIEDLLICYKIATGSETGAVAGMSGGVSNNKYMLQFRGDEVVSTFTPADTAVQAAVGDPTAQTVNASGQTTPLIVLAAYASSGAIDPRTFSPAADAELTDRATIFYAKYKIYNTSPADVTVDMDDEGLNILASFYGVAA